MSIDDNKPYSSSFKRNRAISLFGALIFLVFLPILPVFAPSRSLAEAEGNFVLAPDKLAETVQTPLIQENSFLTAGPHYADKPANSEFTVLETIPVVVTAYSSSVWETDDTPFVTASGTRTRDGVAASNLLPFNTKLRIPEHFGEKVFIVEDRMNKRMDDFQIDIWFPTSQEAKQFGVKYTYIETLQ